jgi:hypothetical protein
MEDKTKNLVYAVEDDEGIQELYQGALEENYDVRIFPDGESFLAAFASKKPALVLLDIMLPDMDGYSILVKIRERDERLPVIVVSAKSDELSLVKGLNKGADDYITKPFSILELLARIKSALRRTSLSLKRVSGFEIDGNTYTVRYDGKELGLTLKEFNLFKMLTAKSGITLTREELLTDIWGMDYEGETRTLDMHIASLRDKIHKAGGGDCIVTVRGVGYRFQQS